MADETFPDLGIRPELVDAVRGLGYARPTALQRASVPVLRRGGNAVLRGAAGSGKTAAYGLGLIDRLAAEDVPVAEGPRPRVLVIVPTSATASRIAASLARFARSVDRRASALEPGWARPEEGVDVIVASPSAALREVEAARLKLDAVEAFVLDGASAVAELGSGEPVETLTLSLPRDAQRVLLSAEFSEAVEDYIERHVRRALRIPSRSETAEGAGRAGGGAVGYIVVDEAARPAVASDLILSRSGARPPVVYCRTEPRADALAEDLGLRGFRLGGDGDATVTADGGPEAEGAYAISYDVPFDTGQLTSRHGDGGIVLLAPRELSHLREIAGAARLELRAEAEPTPTPVPSDVASFRDRLRSAAETEDLSAQFLVLEPLLDEISAAELAAAATALLRRRAPVREPKEPQPREAVSAPSGQAPPAWVRLFMSVGHRDEVRPGDLVGAITGEVGVSGDDIGRIDIRDTFSIVEVTKDIAQRVIETMNGITLKGRSLRVDYDRKNRGPRRSAGR